MPSFSDCSITAIASDEINGRCDGYSNSSCTRDNMTTTVSLIIPSSGVDYTGDTMSERVQVAKLISVDPALVTSTNPLSADTTTLTVYGSGWDTTGNGENNLFALWSAASTPCSYSSTDDVTIKSKTISVSSGDSSNVIIEFSQLSNINEGILCGYTSTTDEIKEGDGTQIAKIVSVLPSLETSNVFLSSDTTKMTIKGTGFDSYNGTYQDTMVLSLSMESGRSFSTSTQMVESSELTDYIAVTIPSRTSMILTFCKSSDPPSVASDICALQLTDDRINIQASVSFQLTSSSPLYSSNTTNVGKVGATKPCNMQKRFGYHACSSRGVSYDSTKNVDTNETLDVSNWKCQCECNQTNPSDFAYGEYCESTLMEEQVKCHYRCMSTEDCANVFETWQAEYIYTSHPNYRSPDPVAFYEYQIGASATYKYTKLGSHLSVASFFLCMDTSLNTQRVLLGGDDSTNILSEIVSSSSTSSAGVARRRFDFVATIVIVAMIVSFIF